MVPATSLTGFSGETIWPLGQLRLLVTIGDADHSTKAWINFMIVRSLSPYNGIIGRLGIREIQAVPSTAHGMLKFLANGGIVTIHRVPRSVAEHRLNILEGYLPVRQKKRGQAPERAKAIQAEIAEVFPSAIAVITDQPIKQIMSRLDVAGRLQKWSIMLGEHNITYRPRTSVKGQILWDFLVEKPDENLPETPVANIPQESWTLFTDGSSCIDGSGAGLILTSPDGMEFTYTLIFQFTASKNKAEYEALIAGLQIAAQMGVCNMHVSVDSKLVANQVPRAYVAKEQNMIKYLEKVKSLVKIASTSFAHLSKQVLVEILKEKSIHDEEVATVVEEEGITWMTPIIEYLKDGTLPGDRKEASKLRIKARHYELLEGVLYK
ncbi:reverse transcriptase domain-containing protein, partial [Tanacetum coccineum]